MKINAGVVWLAFLVPAVLSLWIERQPDASGQARTIPDFAARLQEYEKVRQQAMRPVPRLPKKAEPEQIAEHRRALAQSLRAARANARQGDLFVPAVMAELKRIIASETTGPGSAPARRAVRVGNPAVEGDINKIKIAVNAQYPGDQPVSMVPPSLLMKMPELPKGLEYRFVGRDLVLLDTEPGLIVDFIPEALP
jgi:hypothetical protein